MKIDKSLMAGSTTMLVLKLLEEQDMYGYQMIDTLEKRSDDTFTLKAGTLYPILHGLEQKKLIESYEGPSDAGKPRRYYHLTKLGLRSLREKEAEWVTYSTAVGKVLGGVAYAAR